MMRVGNLVEMLVISVLTKIGLLLCEVEVLDGLHSSAVGNNSKVDEDKFGGGGRLLTLISLFNSYSPMISELTVYPGPV